MTTELYTAVCQECSAGVTRRYSTSFSLASRLLKREIRESIYAIYGFVRVADEIVDTFSGHNQRELLESFREDTYRALERRISINPILHSFQLVAKRYDIERRFIEAFFTSMAADLETQQHDRRSFDRYVYGSAEVVGLMCLKVFVEGDSRKFRESESAARALGAAFQKVNFLRDWQYDRTALGRSYFPGTSYRPLTEREKKHIEDEIEADFARALPGIRKLPHGAREGVYLAYLYFYALLHQLKRMKPKELMERRARVPDTKKALLLARCWTAARLGVI